MKMIYFVIVVLVTGCASNSGVVPIGPDTFMVSRQAATGFSGSGTLKSRSIPRGESILFESKEEAPSGTYS